MAPLQIIRTEYIPNHVWHMAPALHSTCIKKSTARERVRWCRVGWSEFWDEKYKHLRQVVPNCWRTALPKFNFLMLLFNLAQSLRKFWLLHYCKISKNYFLNQVGVSFEKLKICFPFTRSKTILVILGAEKIKLFHFHFISKFLFAILLWSKKNVFAKL